MRVIGKLRHIHLISSVDISNWQPYKPRCVISCFSKRFYIFASFFLICLWIEIQITIHIWMFLVWFSLQSYMHDRKCLSNLFVCSCRRFSWYFLWLFWTKKLYAHECLLENRLKARNSTQYTYQSLCKQPDEVLHTNQMRVNCIVFSLILHIGGIQLNASHRFWTKNREQLLNTVLWAYLLFTIGWQPFDYVPNKNLMKSIHVLAIVYVLKILLFNKNVMQASLKYSTIFALANFYWL